MLKKVFTEIRSVEIDENLSLQSSPYSLLGQETNVVLNIQELFLYLDIMALYVMRG